MLVIQASWFTAVDSVLKKYRHKPGDVRSGRQVVLITAIAFTLAVGLACDILLNGHRFNHVSIYLYTRMNIVIFGTSVLGCTR